jgi:hypothetical protein
MRNTDEERDTERNREEHRIKDKLYTEERA